MKNAEVKIDEKTKNDYNKKKEKSHERTQLLRQSGKMEKFFSLIVHAGCRHLKGEKRSIMKLRQKLNKRCRPFFTTCWPFQFL